MIRKIRGKTPKIHKTAFVAETAAVIGEVDVGKEASIWFGAVLRGDINGIRIGHGSNIQEQCVIHVDDRAEVGEAGAAVIGDRVTVGHGAILHSCRIGDECLIGMGAIILSGAEVGAGSIIAAGALVREGQKIPPGSLVMGIPAAVKGPVKDEWADKIRKSALHYTQLAREYME